MKVIIGRNGISGSAVNDKARLSHEVEKKPSLSTQIENAISSRKARTVGNNSLTAQNRNLRPDSLTLAPKSKFVSGQKLASKKRYKVLNNNSGTTGINVLTNKKARTISSRKVGKLRQAKSNKLNNLAKKPAEVLKQQFYSQAAKSDDNGVKAVKLGMQAGEYSIKGAKGLKTAAKTGAKTVKGGAKLTMRIYRGVNAKATKAAQKVAKQAGKATVKVAAKATVNNTAKAAAKAANTAAKAAVQATSKVISFISSTMPYSLIVIGAVLLIIIISLCITDIIGGAGGAVAGGGAWLVDDEHNQTPEEIYETYETYIEQAKDVLQTQVKDALESEVTSFCSGDTSDPRKIIQYIDITNNRLFYPANGADTTINSLIEAFGTEDYVDYLSLLFVLMTREKQQADGVSDDVMYDFDFEEEDFEEFMRTVDENICQWGDTFVIKITSETTGEYCPGHNCKTKTISGCHCASYTDDEGKVHYYCGGHPYCPGDHTKLTVQLYTVQDYYGGLDYSEIYNFTDTEKARYEASRSTILDMLDYWE